MHDVVIVYIDCILVINHFLSQENKGKGIQESQTEGEHLPFQTAANWVRVFTLKTTKDN